MLSRFLKCELSQFSKVAFQVDIELARCHFCFLNTEPLRFVMCGQETQPITPGRTYGQNKGCFGFDYAYQRVWMLGEPPDQMSPLAGSVFRALIFAPLLNSCPGAVHCVEEINACSNTCVLRSSRER